MTEEEIQLKSAKLREVLRIARETDDGELEQSAQSALLALRQSSVRRDRHAESEWRSQFAA